MYEPRTTEGAKSNTLTSKLCDSTSVLFYISSSHDDATIYNSDENRDIS